MCTPTEYENRMATVESTAADLRQDVRDLKSDVRAISEGVHRLEVQLAERETADRVRLEALDNNVKDLKDYVQEKNAGNEKTIEQNQSNIFKMNRLIWIAIGAGTAIGTITDAPDYLSVVSKALGGP